MSDRATIRPVTLARLVEVTYVCRDNHKTTENIESALNVSRRRARETILEALRVGFLEEDGNDEVYRTTTPGEEFLDAIKNENWPLVDSILIKQSPHYRQFRNTLEEHAPVNLSELLNQLEEVANSTPYSYNQTSMELLGDWGERLGQIQRNAFTGRYYAVRNPSVPDEFASVLLQTYDEQEDTTGVNLRQRYLSIPRIREALCEKLRCSRDVIDEALLALCQQNVGKLELSGAPIDTGAKDSVLGIKSLELDGDDALVSTSQSSQQVMSGIEQLGKEYYYIAVHDRNITFQQEGKI